MNLQAKLKAARAEANQAYADSGKNVNAPAYVAAMNKVRALCDQVNAAAPKEEFCSVDSGFHRTRLLDGRKI